MFRLSVHQRSTRGISLVEALVAAALISIMFAGILGSFRLLLTLIGHTRAEAGAVAIANEQIEALRALPYNSVGTQGGIPAGSIPQNKTVALNQISYNVRTFIQYVDAPEDGTGASDDNGITADYKRAKVEVSWSVRGVSKNFFLITNIIPRGIETLAGGGTLTVNVFDASVVPIEDVAVRVVNASTSPSIDVTTYTNSAGIAMFPGAPAAGGYQVFVSKPGYSSAQTYSASTTNPNPNPPNVAVVESEVSTLNFAIDETADLTVETIAPPSTAMFEDLFDDASLTSVLTSVAIAGGEATLAGAPGSYDLVGQVHATATDPATLDAWIEARVTHTTPADTWATFQIYSVDGAGVYALVPDADLPGNAAGFTVSPINLSGLDIATYPRLAIGATLGSAAGVDTPRIDEWAIEYATSITPVPNITFSISGSKSIGTDGGGVPVLKFDTVGATDGTGDVTLTDLEWDQYAIAIDGAVEGYDIADMCPPSPVTVAPGSASTTVLTLVPHTNNTLRVVVRASDGTLLSGASVRLTRGGFDETELSSSCGQVFFSGLASAADYTLEVSAPGYLDETFLNVNVSGQSVTTAPLTEN